MSKNVYLISASSYRTALNIAYDMNLKRGEFIYIPLYDEKMREMLLRGRRVVNKKYLVGIYTDWEVYYLTRGEMNEHHQPDCQAREIEEN